MAGFFERKQSVAARWCHRLSVFLIPYFGLAILLHRVEAIETPQLFVIFAIGLSLAVLSFILALKAAADLWNKGHRGGKDLVRGLFLASLILVPFGYYAFLALSLPLASDVSTNTFNPPDYLSAVELRQKNSAKGMNSFAVYDDVYSESQVNAYPKIGPRRYPAGAERVLVAVQRVIADNGWRVTATKGIPENRDDEDATLSADQLEDNNSGAGEEGFTPEDISVEAVVSSLIFGFKYDVVVHIVSEDVNTLVEMRSSSRWGAHDFGSNAAIIEGFLAKLDLQLLGIAGEG